MSDGWAVIEGGTVEYLKKRDGTATFWIVHSPDNFGDAG